MVNIFIKQNVKENIFKRIKNLNNKIKKYVYLKEIMCKRINAVCSKEAFMEISDENYF